MNLFGKIGKFSKLVFAFGLFTLSSTTFALDVTTFDELNSAINNSAALVTFKDNLSATSGFNSDVTNRMTIEGEGFDLLGNSNYGMYNEGNLTINNIGTITEDEISDGFSNFSSVAIENYGALTITNSVFTSNSGDGAGGAIYNNSRGTITLIDNVNFTDNYADDVGGALFNKGNIDKIQNSTFEYNESFGGGAIVNEYGAVINLIDNVTFKGNYAYDMSGAISNMEAYIAEISNSKFIENEAYIFGGAIKNFEYSDIGKIDAEFTSNFAYQGGGAIMNSGIIESVNGAFTNNESEIGGAIYNTNYNVMGNRDDDGTIGTLTGTFDGNIAYSEGYYAAGGAISNSEGYIYEITNSKFINNKAEGVNGAYAYGGAIDNEYGYIGSLQATFIGNQANSEGGEAYGGAISNSGQINIVAKTMDTVISG
ncbi:hypothetical protein IJ425_03860, partial [bacterium]|nr:hypothetical protein [bacterium]